MHTATAAPVWEFLSTKKMSLSRRLFPKSFLGEAKYLFLLKHVRQVRDRITLCGIGFRGSFPPVLP